MKINENPPRLVQRRCGGWIALAPLGASLRIGASGKTETQAREHYVASLSACRRTLTLGATGRP